MKIVVTEPDEIAEELDPATVGEMRRVLRRCTGRGMMETAKFIRQTMRLGDRYGKAVRIKMLLADIEEEIARPSEINESRAAKRKLHEWMMEDSLAGRSYDMEAYRRREREIVEKAHARYLSTRKPASE